MSWAKGGKRAEKPYLKGSLGSMSTLGCRKPQKEIFAIPKPHHYNQLRRNKGTFEKEAGQAQRQNKERA
ncbi:MAG: hypothetical protein K0B87_04320 [Candidatus Syntrophosphaera sp.]|nr:hypothetical protein [Candidatus Syntrophosphaera sp.]